MKRYLVLIALCFVLVWSCQPILLFGQEDLPGNASKMANSNETDIRKSITSYVSAFNKAGAEAVAAHWSVDGEFITPDGNHLRGRQQLKGEFSKYFEETKNAKIELLNTSIKFLSPSVAQETGVAIVTVPGQEPSETEYEAIHVKTSMGWKIDRVKEQQHSKPSPTHNDHLQSLDWLVGSWIDSDENSTIETTCRWTTNKNFLVRSFKMLIEDRVDFEGTQIIGWDAHAGAIRSWTFDSDGGFGVGRWSGDGDRWTVSTLNVLPDGRRASGTNIYDRIDENNLLFHSIGRQVDGELMPNIDPVSVVRISAHFPSHSNALLEDSTP